MVLSFSFFKIWIGELKVSCIFLSFQVFFVESVCEDPEVIAQNIVVSFVLLSLNPVESKQDF